MSIYTISDLHLSLNSNKSMEIFSGWNNYVERIKDGFETTVKDIDTVVLVGDLSWGMTLEESLKDFLFVDSLPGKKIILKGNHDYFWTTRNKMENFFDKNNITSIKILQNNCFTAENYAICGTRGWVSDGTEEAAHKVILREAMRLELSIKEAQKTGLEILCFLHYPPVYQNNRCDEILEVLQKYSIKKCFYGHIHGAGSSKAVVGDYDGISFVLVSADYLDFKPLQVV